MVATTLLIVNGVRQQALRKLRLSPALEKLSYILQVAYCGLIALLMTQIYHPVNLNGVVWSHTRLTVLVSSRDLHKVR